MYHGNKAFGVYCLQLGISITEDMDTGTKTVMLLSRPPTGRYENEWKLMLTRRLFVVILHDLRRQTARTMKADWSERGPFNPHMAATIEVNIRVR